MQKRTPHGSCAEVFIREKTEPPEIIDESEALDIIAGASGYIVETEVLGGIKEVDIGDTVGKGQVHVRLAEYSGASENMNLRAKGQIIAKTWYRLTGRLPLRTIEKRYTGKKKTDISLQLGTRVIDLSKNRIKPFAYYDKMYYNN